MKVKILLLLIFLFPFQIFCQSKNANEPIRFQIKNAGINVDGTLSDWEYEISFDPKNLTESKIKATANPQSIETGIKLRDKHLQGRQYFNVEKFPEIRISSKRFTSKGKGRFVGIFELQIKDVKKEISIPFAMIKTGKNQSFSAEFTINRLDYGIGESSLVLGDEVKIMINLEK